MQFNPEHVVHKFGGSSLANATRFENVKQILQGGNEIIVVSATQGTTSALQNALDFAKQQMDYLSTLDIIEKSHVALIEKLLPVNQQTEIETQIKTDISDIKDILRAVEITTSYSKEIQDLILGYGEQWSAKILTIYLSDFNRVIYLDAAEVLFISEKDHNIGIDWQRSKTALENYLENKTFDQIVITGFIAATSEGKRTTLGRNGSDFSGGIFAKLFSAKALYIWTDVDGIYSADPGKVHSAFVLDSLSYQEALELAYFGAKVLHPKTMAPLIDDKIPIYIKNSLNPEAKGTYVSAEKKESKHPVKGLSCIEDVALINIEGTGLMGVSGMAARVFEIIRQENISVILISQASSEHSLCFVIPKIYADLALTALKNNLQFEISQKLIEKINVDKNCAILAAVGDGMVGAIGIAGKLCDTLAKTNINIHAIAQGSSERNISVVIRNEDINRSMRAIHAGFYLSNKTISIGLIGPGMIGSTLLKQIQMAQNHLREKYKVNLFVRGIMKSDGMLLSHEAIDLETWQDQFANHQIKSNLEQFANHVLSDDMPHAVMIDCTASKKIATEYIDFIGRGIHVITPNKHTNAGDLNYYKQLKLLSQQKNCHYLYETTVCAGLPVINTLQDIVKTGDDVIAIEGVVSGTLSYIFNELAQGKKFSSIVIEAKNRGYTEPDPREDLSGMDVARKLICLAREIGHDVSLQDVKVHDLVPEALRTCSVDEFLAKLPEYDAEMENLIMEANSKNEKLCYRCAINQNGGLSVDMASLPQTHPLSRLRGSDNMLIFQTRRYLEPPLVIQGPGAGAEVTAAGIFADLLRLVSFLS